jgi:hypothetical protein
MLLLTAVLWCSVAVDPVDAALAQVARFDDGGVAHTDLAENLRAWRDGERTLVQLAADCPAADWSALRAHLAAAMVGTNRAVWHACLQAIVAREGADALELVLVQVQEATDPERVAFAARMVARLGPSVPPDACPVALATLAGILNDQSRSLDRSQLFVAMASLGPAAVDEVLRIGAEEPVKGPLRSVLPHALACTGDPRALAPLLALHASSSSDGERTATTAALGLLARQLERNGSSGIEAVAALRATFRDDPSPAVAAAAGLALARVGALWGDTEIAHVFELADARAARKDALRALLAARVPLLEEQRLVVEAYAQDEHSSDAVRKIAGVLLEGLP